LTVYLQFDSYKPGTALLAALNTSLPRSNFNQEFELDTAIAAYNSGQISSWNLISGISIRNFNQEFEYRQFAVLSTSGSDLDESGSGNSL
jgi:hypothetical protein